MRRWNPGWAVVLLLFLSLSACGPAPTATPSPLPTAPPTPLPTAIPLPLAEDEFTSAAGGFAVRYPRGWQYLAFEGAVIFFQNAAVLQLDVPTATVMIEAGALTDLTMAEVGQTRDAVQMVQAVLESMRASTSNLEAGALEEIKVGGQPAVAVRVHGSVAGQAVAGRIICLHQGERGVIIVGAGAAAQWAIFAPTFEAMLATLRFFPPQVPVIEPTAGPIPSIGPVPSGGPPAGPVWRLGGESPWEVGKPNALAGLDVGPDGRVYVADRLSGIIVVSPTGEIVSTFGEDMRLAADVKVAADGTLYVAAKGEQAVYAFSPAGKKLRRWGEAGSGSGQFSEASPEFLAVCPDGTVYVADTVLDAQGHDRERIQAFDGAGQFLFQWPVNTSDELFGVSGLDCGPDGRLYVGGWFADAIRIYDGGGRLQEELRPPALAGAGLRGLAVAPDGSLYVGTWQGWAGRFDAQGRLLSRWGEPFDGEGDMAPGQVYNVYGIAVDAEGNGYLSDWTGTHTYLTRFSFP